MQRSVTMPRVSGRTALSLSLLCVLICLRLTATEVPDATAAPSARTGDYNEHLEIDFDDKEDTPPPWEADEAAFTSPPREAAEDTDWVPDAVRDVAYYLRQFKFNEYDRRYHTVGNFSGERGFLGAFPELRVLHWEVRDACEEGFLECLRLLQGPVDGIFESVEAKVRYENKEQVLALDKMCSDLREEDEAHFGGFVGPLDRFQWRATGAYYMCVFTMQREPALRHLGEACDNFAWCLDWETGPSHGDPRAADAEPFHCARYSFCPDPCCPKRVARSEADCVEENPCRHADVKLPELEAPQRPRCSLAATANGDLRGMMRNRWNTSCACPVQGYHWEARYGFCVDTDECETQAPCSTANHEECVNAVGSFACRCRWGWLRGEAGRCVRDRAALAVAAARRGGAVVASQDGDRRDVWQVLEEILVPQEPASSSAASL